MAEIEYYLRFILCLLALAVLLNCAVSLLRLKPKKKIYATLTDISKNKEYEITCYETSVGRSRFSDIRINLPSVSRAHAVIALKKDGFYVFDTESKQGVYVNGEKIEKSEKLSHGDTVAFGMGIMKFRITNEAADDIKDPETEYKEYALVNIVDGAQFPLEGGYVTIGRRQGSNIEINDKSISREQAALTLSENGAWLLHNFSRTNITQINGEPLKKPTELKIGDVIKFGDYAFIFDEKE